MNIKISFFSALCGALLWSGNTLATTPKAVVEHYADIATAVFEDSLQAAKDLRASIQTLVDQPSEANMMAARQAWLAARVPYQQSEVFRFGNAIVDEWEGQLNAWPLDEGLIDYVAPGYHAEMGNVVATANIIGNPKLKVGNTTLDLSKITPELLADLNELGGSEANVATGYHAIEFLLWGQDLNGTNPGAGQRPYTDYATGDKCTNDHCARRRQYLMAAADLLVKDLQYMVDQWKPGKQNNYRNTLLSSPQDSLQKILFGMGSLSLGELAGERMKVPLEAASTEDEHDCFSDNTHNSHYYNAKGIENIYYGRYLRSHGQWLKGPSLSDLVEKENPILDTQAKHAFNRTEAALKKMVEMAEDSKSPMKFDQMIAEKNEKGQAVIQDAIEALVAQTAVIEKVAKALGINQLSPETANHQF